MKRVLVIDDDQYIQELLKLALEKAGYEAMVADNGDMGLDIHRETPADLIITDLFMPGKEGTQLLMEMRDEFPQTKVIVISGGGGIEGVDFLKLASHLGATQVFQKPFTITELLEAVREALE